MPKEKARETKIRDGAKGIYSYVVSTDGVNATDVIHTKGLEISIGAKLYKMRAPIQFGDGSFYISNSIESSTFAKLMRDKLADPTLTKKAYSSIIIEKSDEGAFEISSGNKTIFTFDDDFFTRKKTGEILNKEARALFVEQFFKALNKDVKIEYAEDNEKLKPSVLALPHIYDPGIYGPIFTNKDDAFFNDEKYKNDMLAIATYFTYGAGSDSDFKPEKLAITATDDEDSTIQITYNGTVVTATTIPHTPYNVDVLTDYIGALNPSFKDYLMAKDVQERIELYGEFSDNLGVDAPSTVAIKRLDLDKKGEKEKKQGRKVTNPKGQFMVSHQGIDLPKGDKETQSAGLVIASMFFDPAMAMAGTAKASNDPSFSSVFRPGSSRNYYSPTFWHRSLFESDLKVMTDFGVREAQTPALTSKTKGLKFKDFQSALSKIVVEGGLGFEKVGGLYKIANLGGAPIEVDFQGAYAKIEATLTAKVNPADPTAVTGAIQVVASNIAQAVILANKVNKLGKIAGKTGEDLKALNEIEKAAVKNLKKSLNPKGKSTVHLRDLPLDKVAQTLDPVLEQELQFSSLSIGNARDQILEVPRFDPSVAATEELEEVTRAKDTPHLIHGDSPSVRAFYSWKTKGDEVGISLSPIDYMHQHSKRDNQSTSEETHFRFLLDNISNTPEEGHDFLENIEVLVSEMRDYYAFVTLRESRNPRNIEFASGILDTQYKDAFGPEDEPLSMEVYTTCRNIFDTYNNMQKVLTTGQFRNEAGEVLILREDAIYQYKDLMVTSMAEMAKDLQATIERTATVGAAPSVAASVGLGGGAGGAAVSTPAPAASVGGDGGAALPGASPATVGGDGITGVRGGRLAARATAAASRAS